jgi:hypothetical protein
MFCQKLSNCHISLWRKVFFPFLTNFFSFISKLPSVARGHQKNKKTQSLIGNMVVGRFPKKIRNKTFYFHCKKNFTIFFFYLVLALESISGVQSRLFGQTPLNIIFIQKLSNCHISLWRKVFFPFLTNFFSIHIKVSYCCEGSQIKIVNAVTYWEHDSWLFSKKN